MQKNSRRVTPPPLPRQFAMLKGFGRPVTDPIAIGAVLAPMILVWWRGVVRSGQKNIDM
jgi:hypothetical protein